MKDKLIAVLKQNNMSFAWVMMYFYDQVVMGKYEKEELLLLCDEYNEDLCYEIHLFNKEKELRAGSNFEFIEIKSPIEKRFYMEEKFFVLGNKAQISGDSTKLTQYGRMVKLPLILKNEKPNHDLRLVVHHLFDEETGYVKGYRLVDIEGGK